MFKLDDKVALVTGGGSGIGKAIAELFADRGATVWVIDRDATAGRQTADRIVAGGGRAQFEKLDVTDENAVDALAKRLTAIDVLANVAGIGHVGTLLETTAADLDRLYAVNVRGIFNVCKAFVPAMIARGSGSVINLASVGGVIAVRDRLAYTTTKFAVVGLTKAMALDHSHTRVRFNSICPGRVNTPFVAARIAESADPTSTARAMAATQLAGRMVEPAEVAAAALYLASDESAMVSGTELLIESAWSAGK